MTKEIIGYFSVNHNGKRNKLQIFTLDFLFACDTISHSSATKYHEYSLRWRVSQHRLASMVSQFFSPKSTLFHTLLSGKIKKKLNSFIASYLKQIAQLSFIKTTSLAQDVFVISRVIFISAFVSWVNSSTDSCANSSFIVLWIVTF